MNFVLGVLSICLTTLISAMIAEKYKEEYEFYSDFSKFNQQLLNEVSFSKKSILTLIKSNKNNTFAKLCEKFLNNENYEIKINKKGKEDSEFIKEYLKNIGNTDKETQIVFFEENR